MTTRNITCLAVILLLISPITYAKLTVHGSLTQQPLFINNLLSRPISDYHRAWLEPIYQTLKNNEPIVCPGDNILCALNNMDVEIFLSTALKKYFNYSITETNKNKYFAKQHFFLKIQNDNSVQHLYLKNERTKLELINTAKRALDIVKNDTVIILGQTPSLIGISMQEIQKYEHSNAKIIPIAFSGHPDLLMNNRKKKSWAKSAKNIITLKRQVDYREYLAKQGISPEHLHAQNKLYIMDYSTGPSISAFLLFLARWYQEDGVNLPDIYFLNLLNPKDKHSCNDGIWAKDINPKINMPLNDNLSLSIDTSYLDMDYTILSKLVETKANARTIAPMHAINWGAIQNHEIPTNTGKRLIKLYKKYIHQIYG